MMIRASAADHARSNDGSGGTPGDLYWLNANTARFDIRPSNGFPFTEVTTPVVISSGAVSPMMRAIASITPVTMPAIAVGRTTLTTVFHFGTPSAYAASRRWLGTMRSISSVDLTTIGIIRTESA